MPALGSEREKRAASPASPTRSFAATCSSEGSRVLQLQPRALQPLCSHVLCTGGCHSQRPRRGLAATAEQ